MTHQHISSAFDTDLEAVQAQIMKMGGLVEDAIRQSMTSLETRDQELAQQVRAADGAIDHLEEAINEGAARIIALRAPTAIDLRLILSVIKISGNLERIGDYAKNMAKRTEVLSQVAPINDSIGTGTVPLAGWVIAPSARQDRRERIVDALRRGDSLDAIASRELVSARTVRRVKGQLIDI